MDMSNKDYDKFVQARAEKSPIVKNCLFAFLIGGAICTLGQGLFDLYGLAGMSEENVSTLVPMTLVFLAALTTGLGWFGRLAKHAGAGTLVPITGFANAVASPAIEFKAEGFITGTAAKMFIIAGPVIVYGISASVIYGLIYYLIG